MHEARVGAFLLDRLRQRIDRGLVGEVGLMRGEFLLRMTQLQMLEQLVGLGLRRAVGEGHVVPALGEQLHDRGAEPASAAGDQNAPQNVVGHQRGSRPMTSETFCPPKPNELDSTCVTRASRATFGTTSSGIAGSGTA